MASDITVTPRVPHAAAYWVWFRTARRDRFDAAGASLDQPYRRLRCRACDAALGLCHAFSSSLTLGGSAAAEAPALFRPRGRRSIARRFAVAVITGLHARPINGRPATYRFHVAVLIGRWFSATLPAVDGLV